MKKLLLKIVLFSFLCVPGLIGVLFLADGTSDSHYLKVSSPQQHSLILGTSRARQALKPDVLDEHLFPDRNETKMFNFAFTIGISPYGPAYFEAIKKKLDEDTTDGVFILGVDPWILSSNKENPNDASMFRENERFLANLSDINSDPNFLYLLSFYDGQLYNIIKYRLNPTPFLLHKNGWLEVQDFPITEKDNNAVKRHIKVYTGLAQSRLHSSTRLNYLEKIIHFLQNYGSVYLVRLPVHSKMFQLEDKFMPDFDEVISEISKRNAVPYLSFRHLENHYNLNDAIHIHRDSADSLTQKVAEWIKDQMDE